MLLSIGISITIVALLRLLPTVVVAVVGLLWLLAYHQLALPGLVAQFNEAVTYWQALLVYFSYTTFPATEFSILGWEASSRFGCAFGTQVRKPSVAFAGELAVRGAGALRSLGRVAYGAVW